MLKHGLPLCSSYETPFDQRRVRLVWMLLLLLLQRNDPEAAKDRKRKNAAPMKSRCCPPAKKEIDESGGNWAEIGRK